jgi:hypothetical protein
MVIYYLHHCNFRCNVSLLYVERWQIQRRDIMPKANSKAATKRNNRKIHTRKFLATPEGKSWLERKTIEEAEMKPVSEARKFI